MKDLGIPISLCCYFEVLSLAFDHAFENAWKVPSTLSQPMSRQNALASHHLDLLVAQLLPAPLLKGDYILILGPWNHLILDHLFFMNAIRFFLSVDINFQRARK